MIKIFYLLLFVSLNNLVLAQLKLPVLSYDRSDVHSVDLTAIGEFGLERKARANISAHLHTGIDIKRPTKNYSDEPIFPIFDGIVISMRNDGPYAQLILEHSLNGIMFWSVYEHIAGICCNVGDFVGSNQAIARFMTTKELNSYGWQFDHVHLEIMKQPPIKSEPNEKLPERFYTTYWLSCFNKIDLNYYYYNPLEFLKDF